MRALIVGGLGYIGSALIEYYKQFEKNDVKIDIIDKRFVPHMLAGLPDRFRFTHADMKDAAAMDPLLEKKPDVIYLLAAQVEAEKSIHRQASIWENNYDAMVEVIDKCPKNSRMMFASTGNVFGGVNENEKHMGLTEEDPPKPKYPYAESKVAVERHLAESGREYTVCRFGTNYGYAPGIRFNLVTNNFIKKALAGETITVHGKGDNYRPTVCVKDAARALVYLSGIKEAGGQIYHVVAENYRIAELAEKAASFNPEARIEHIAKEVPFSSYNLAADKIRGLGFDFEWNMEKAMADMVEAFKCLRN